MTVNLADIIAYTETNNNLKAFRFEESYYQTISDKRHKKVIDFVKKVHDCSTNSARVILSSSWGKYQIMGLNLYTICNLSCNVFDYLQTELLQDISFKTFLQKQIRIQEDDILKDIKELFYSKKDIRLASRDLTEFTQKFKQHLLSNKDKYQHLLTFINRYNGARFLSDAFYSYLLRMLYFYEKLGGAV